MRSVFAFLTVLALAIGPTLAARADTPADAPATSTAKTRQARLDKLFSDLGRERNEKAAERIAGTIWQAWLDSGSANINLMMLWAQKAMEAQKFDVALDFLDQVTTLDPTYAEGWNRRATVHYMMKNYAKSLADIERTLQLEPRHFGALSGMARIMADTGHKQAALDAWQRVLAIYPMMRSAQSEVSTLSEELAGEGI
ncbi:MAG: tetratricopeptide repeat protein [Mesorhizobium sp.]